MNLKKSVLIAVAFLTTSASPAAETVWPKSSAGDLSIFVTMLRFGIHADYCSAQVPPLKPGFENLMDNLNIRIHRISENLLASDLFNGMKEKPVPAAIVDALKDSFDDVRHNVERRDAASICPKTLQDFGEMDDESLKSGLTEALTAVQNMIQNLEKQN